MPTTFQPAKTTLEAEPSTLAEVITSYKAFDAKLQCRGFQYAVGATYTHEGTVRSCAGGFHACENPLDVLNFYDLCESRFAVVEQSGGIDRGDEQNTKIASGSITVKAELSLPEFVGRAVTWLLDHVKGNGGEAASGDSSKLAASGKQSVVMSAAPGCRAKAGADGAIALAWHDGTRPRIAVGYIGEDGIKADTWYEVRDGKLVECQ